MTKQTINVGSGEYTGDGESLRSALVKTNDNFTEVYTNIDTINNAGYLTSSTLAAYLPIDDDTEYATETFVTSQGYLTTATLPPYPTNVGAFENDVGYLTTATLPPYPIVETDRISSGTTSLVISEDGTVTFPPGATMYQNTNSVVYNVVNLILDDTLEYSTTSTDALVVGEYGLTNGVAAPYSVFKFTTTPPIPLYNGDVVAGAGIPVPSTIIYAGTGTWTSVVITDSNFAPIEGLVQLPTNGISVIVARPSVNQSLTISTPANNDIVLTPGTGGHIIINDDLIPLHNGSSHLGSIQNRWAELWMGAGTIYLKDETLGTDIALTGRDGVFRVLGAGGISAGEFTLVDNRIVLQDSARDIIIGDTTATGYVQFNRPVKMTGDNNETVFEIVRDGLVSIYPKQNISVSESALSIVGNAAGLQQPRNFTGTMLQITGQNGISSRVSIDSFGTGAYPVIAGRAARGTVQEPTATKAKDILFRLATQGYGDNQYVQSIGRISIEASQDFTNAHAGTQVVIQTTPNDSNVITTSTVFNDQGISFVDNANGGITFRNGSRQTTAFTGTVDVSVITNLNTVAVTSINIGADGLSGSSGPGTASINNDGVWSAVGTENQIKVNGSYTTSSKHQITLSLPQDIAPTSNVTFNDVNVIGELNFLGTSTILIPNTVEGTLLYLGFTATNTSTIDGGGIQLGNTATGIHSILWNRAQNYWDFDGAGINTQILFATSSTLGNITVNDGAHFGYRNLSVDRPLALIQADANDNNFAEILLQNHSTGTQASANFVAANNLSDGYTYSITMGKLSSTWTAPGPGSPLQSNDGYIGNNNGNLIIASSDESSSIKLSIGFPGTVEATFDTNGLNVANTVTSARFYGPLTGNVTGDVTGSVSGNAGSVTNGVYSNQTYTNPTWIGSLAGSKISGAVALATTVTNGVYTTDNGTVSNNMLAGSIANNKLAFNQITFNAGTGIGVSVASPSLGGSTTISNTGVTRITTGTGIIISTSTGEIVISAAVPQGPTGYTGSTGTQGLVGYTGSTGTQGVIGYTGSTGTQGVIGYTGSTGTQGVIGYTGSTGTQGVIGYTGSKGVADVYVSSITTGTGIFVTTSTGAVTVSLNTSTLMKEAVSLVSMSTILAGSVTIDPPSFGKNTAIVVTATITGLTTNHHIVMLPSTATIVGFYRGAVYCTSTNVVSAQFHNVSGGNIDMLPFNLSYLAWV